MKTGNNKTYSCKFSAKLQHFNVLAKFSALFRLITWFLHYFDPKNKNNIDKRTSNKSKALAFRFFSLNINAPKRNETITLPLRIILTILIIASS